MVASIFGAGYYFFRKCIHRFAISASSQQAGTNTSRHQAGTNASSHQAGTNASSPVTKLVPNTLGVQYSGW